MSKWESNEEIQIFREYLRIPSVQPDVDYGACVEFLTKQAKKLSLPLAVHYPANEKCPVVVITWEGSKPELPSIMLNSHMDVVPVDEDRWTHAPFAAHIDENGNIYARGAQDMKSVGMQYLAAIRAMKRDGVQPQRTIHVTFVPDEEIGSEFGMKAFVNSDAFRGLNVGFALDEACAYPLNKMLVFHAERTQYCVEVICEGQAGHGSILHENTAGEKIQYMLNKFLEFRQKEVQKLKDNPALKMGDVTTVNLTKIEGGLHHNVVPAEMRITFDIRVAIDVDLYEFEQQIKQWCTEAGKDVTIKIVLKDERSSITKTDSSNPFWVAFENAVKDMQLDVEKWVCPGGTDARFIRQLNLPALGFTPMPNTPIRLHDHDEFIPADVYLNGIDVYKKIITNLGSA